MRGRAGRPVSSFSLEVTIALVPGDTLITETSAEGCELAITLARRSVAAIQTDHDTRLLIRRGYATSADSLTMVTHVVAAGFAAVAAANICWHG